MMIRIFILSFLLTGCSTLSKTINYEIAQNEKLSRTFVYDWCEESQLTLGIFGPVCVSYGPPVYSIKSHAGIYTFYPLPIEHNELTFGPLLAPIFPLNKRVFENKVLEYRVRLAQEGRDILIKPEKIIMKIDGIESSSCLLKILDSDEFGDVFVCELEVEATKVRGLDLILKLTDGTKININYSKKTFWSYRPLVVPAGSYGNKGRYFKIEE